MFEGLMATMDLNPGNVARIGKRDWDGGFYLLVFHAVCMADPTN